MTRSTPKSNMLDAIGDTPCVHLSNITPSPESHAKVYLKLESLNPTGSYKDRMAKSIILQAEQQGHLTKDMTVVEATGGSTGSSLAFVCAVKGYKFRAICSEVFAAEKLKTMTAFGAELELIGDKSLGITANLFPEMRARADELASTGKYFNTSQFTNTDIPVGYEGLGKELLDHFPEGIDGFCASVGTAGMIMGVSRVLKQTSKSTKVVVLEPESAPVISRGQTGSHRVDGIGPGFVPPLLDRRYYDEVRTISEKDARDMCRRLAKEEGVLVGTSTGMNVVAAIQLAKELGPGKVVVTVACDTGLKYLSGDLFGS